MLVTNLDQAKVDELFNLVNSMGTVQYGTQVGGYKEIPSAGTPAIPPAAVGGLPVTASLTETQLEAMSVGQVLIVMADQLTFGNRPVKRNEVYKITGTNPAGEVDGTPIQGTVSFALITRLPEGAPSLRMYETNQGAMIPLDDPALFLDSAAVSFQNRYRELYLRLCDLFGIDPNNPVRQIQ